MKPQLKKELSDLVKQGVLEPVSKSTEWCLQISVQTKKNRQLKICFDPKYLYDELQRERYPLPVIDYELNKAKAFSKVNLRSGYWHCQLDKGSSLLTTIITVFGRYR